MLRAIELLVIMGMCKEMCENLIDGEDIVFYGMIDTGSKIMKKEYVEICIKYFSRAGNSPVTRSKFEVDATNNQSV